MTDPIRVHIRWMIRRDMPEVLAIEAESFWFPWREEDFIRCLRQRNAIGRVAEHGDRVIAFMICELHKRRVHVLNFAVAADYRRRGVGSQIVTELKGKLSKHRRNRLMLEIRESNLAGQRFFKQAGFRAVAVLRDFYEDTPEDAYVMQYRFGEQWQPRNRVSRWLTKQEARHGTGHGHGDGSLSTDDRPH